MLKEIPLQYLKPSATNPRKTFDQVKLEELARSIAAVGVLEPILVRSHFAKEAPANEQGRWRVLNGHRVTLSTHATEGEADTELDALNGKHGYEVVAGERRYRAATLAANGDAATRTVPCIVRELTDVQVLEIQTIENLQRDDLHPLEEAEGYARLMKEAGYDVDQIAQRISKSSKYVYDRIKLLQLVPEAQRVFLNGEISAGHAILLARLSAGDQQRALGIDDDDPLALPEGGLFQREQIDEVPGLELDDEREPRKAVSVRELDRWINDNVRFKPDEVDLPNLFPDTAVALQAAAAEELKVVKITRDHYVQPEARDGEERTYFPQSWKRADGQPEYSAFDDQKASKTCDHSVLGVVVAGPGRGEAFRVCVAKKKCKVHWAAEMKEAEKRPKNGAGSASAPRTSPADQHRKWEEERKQRQAEEARWKKARPKLLEALAEKINTTPALDLVDALAERLGRGGRGSKVTRGKTAEEALRFLAYLMVSERVESAWSPAEQVPKTLKPYGINARKIVDQVAPREKPTAKNSDKNEMKSAAPVATGAPKKNVQTSALASPFSPSPPRGRQPLWDA